MDEEHHHQQQQQYGIGDLRQFMNGTSNSGSLFSAISPPPPPSSTGAGHQLATTAQAQAQHLEMLISARHHHLSTTSCTTTSHDQITMPPDPLGRLLLHQHPPPPPHQHHYNHRHHHHHQLFGSDSSAGTGTSTGGTSNNNNNNNLQGGGSAGGLDMDLQSGGFGVNGSADAGTGRWPRQETLTLLEIRSRLDSKFKEANQKGPLWDEVSRIMCEDHGYQRSGKKCREKFENLYKYYKKTKEGKAGRQDGKHYRFFRQLEALYGDSSSTNPTTETTHLVGAGSSSYPFASNPPNPEAYNQVSRQICDDSFTPSNSSAFVTSSSDDCSDVDAPKRRGKRSWKVKIKDFIDGQMRKLMEKQEAWLEKMMKSIEHKEQERMVREEEWRKQEVARIDREHKFWAKERAWIEARDTGLMEALHKLTGTNNKDTKVVSSSSPETYQELLMRADHHHHQQLQNENGSETITESDSWPECEVTRLIQLRTSMEPMFVQQSGSSSGDEVLWEEIASNMACLGYENRSAVMCKGKWESINTYLMKTKDQCSKKRKESNNNNNNSVSSSCFYFQNNESICNNQGGGEYRESSGQLGDGSGGVEFMTRSLLTQSGHHMNASRPPSDSNAASSTVHGGSFRFFMGDDHQPENLWENYGLKLSKGDD